MNRKEVLEYLKDKRTLEELKKHFKDTEEIEKEILMQKLMQKL